MKTKSELALEILEYSRKNLLVKMPFLNKALFSLKFKETLDCNFASDGQYLFYKANYIIAEYKDEDTYFIRALLHVLLHFLFHHNIVDSKVNIPLWNLACDIATESSINNLNIGIRNKDREAQEKIIAELKDSLFSLNAENIYRYYLEKNPSEEEIDQLRYHFFKDIHGNWYLADPESVKNWEDLSKKIETDLETYHKDTANSLSESLSEINRKKMTLKHFLMRFGMNEETMKVSMEDIDIMLYTYGLSLYDNLALVENQEYREEKKIKDLVIAIDTSGSVKGELVKKFVEYAYSLLSDQSLLSSDMNLYLIQCDDKIEEVKNIRSRKDMDEYLETLELKGFGETDFRPVFTFTNELIQKGLIKDLKGLIYFTDGEGTFPLMKPKYKTAFVIYQKKYHIIDVPPWAMKIELMENDILDEKFE